MRGRVGERADPGAAGGADRGQPLRRRAGLLGVPGAERDRVAELDQSLAERAADRRRCRARRCSCAPVWQRRCASRAVAHGPTASASVTVMAIRTASARWEGTLTEGSGVMRTGKGGLEGNYSFKSRFEEGEGTNPEELIGAAHAGCFSMALSKGLADAGFPPDVDRDHRQRPPGPGRRRADRHPDRPVTVASGPASTRTTFQKVAEGTKAACPISRLLSPGAEITLAATLA